jgi:hypothetical protein
MANGDNATAIGQGATAGANATALGTGASALYANSAAIGFGASASGANNMALGNSANTYTMAGITSAASKAAQSGPVQVVTSDANGNLATMDISGNLGALNARIDSIDGKTNRALQGVAMAFAMAGTPTLMANETFAFSGNWGTYEGQQGLAFGAALRLHRNIQANAGIAYGPNQNTLGGRAGLRVAW